MAISASILFAALCKLTMTQPGSHLNFCKDDIGSFFWSAKSWVGVGWVGSKLCDGGLLTLRMRVPDHVIRRQSTVLGRSQCI